MDNLIPIRVTAIHCQETELLYSPDYLLLLPLNDGAFLQDRTEHLLASGTLLFVSPFCGQKLFLRAGCKSIYAVINASFLEPLIGIPQKSAVIQQADGNTTAKEKLIELFDLQHNMRTGTRLGQMRAAMELLYALEPVITNESSLSPDRSPAKNQRIAEMTAFLDSHFRESIQLGDLAKKFSASRQYISTIFHKEMGIPFSEYLQNLRLSESVRLLLTTDKNITEIAESSGFPNLKSFNQAFRAKYNMPPKEYRRSKSQYQMPSPEKNVLNDVNQLIRPYRLVYQKREEAIHLTDCVDGSGGVPLAANWDILNVDNCYECLQNDIQDSLVQIQKKLQFHYVRMGNILCHEMMPFIPTSNRHRFTNFFRLVDFFKRIGLTPMLSFGDSYAVMPDAVMVSDGAYSMSLSEWLQQLEELIAASVSRWGAAWVSAWRFEFHMPDKLYGSDDHARFMELFAQSHALIRKSLPHVEIGGPSLSMDKAHMTRWKAWFEGLSMEQIRPDFISMELWADYTFDVNGFYGQHNEWKEIRTMGQLLNADAALTTQKVSSLKEMMAQYGYGDTKLYISALGITKYRATSAQVGGHCAAYLIKSILELKDIVDGIGCWKALNSESEYLDEGMIISTGCGLLSRHRLKNINFYASAFWPSCFLIGYSSLCTALQPLIKRAISPF